MIPKLFGAALLLAVGTVASCWNARRENQRLEVLDAWIALLRFLRNQIDCYLRPLEEILADPNAPTIPYGDLGDTRTLPSLLAASAPLLEPEGERLLAAFVREIGTSYRREQVRRCDAYLTALGELRARQAERLPSRVRATSTLLLCATLGVALLLW